jgi:hypothetical protein
MDYETLENEMNNETLPQSKDPDAQEYQSQDTQDASLKSQDDNAERSRLGRKVKYLEETMTSLTSQLDTQTKLLQSLVERMSSKEPVKEDGDEEEVITTKEDVLRVLTEAEKKKAEEKTRYENNYVKTFQSLLVQEDDGIRSDIYKTWNDKYNVVFTGDPVRDAEIGYLKAKVDVLSRHAYKGKEDTPLHPTKSSPSDYSKKYSINSEAVELAQYFGLSDDDVKLALDSDLITSAKSTVNRRGKSL